MTGDWESLARAAKFRAAELARLCSVSLDTLQRHFRTQYNLTLSQWLKEARMRSAYAQLLEGSTLTDVAVAHGYVRLSHFSQDFKICYGIAPNVLLNASDKKTRTFAGTEPRREAGAKGYFGVRIWRNPNSRN
jgi:AraC-like DNA-binding protein